MILLFTVQKVELVSFECIASEAMQVIWKCKTEEIEEKSFFICSRTPGESIQIKCNQKLFCTKSLPGPIIAQFKFKRH